MPIQRRNFTGAEKLAILRQHLIEKTSISDVCQNAGIQPTLFYYWQKKLFEDGVAVFESRAANGRQQAAGEQKIQALEARVQQKNEVLAELMGEHAAEPGGCQTPGGRVCRALQHGASAQRRRLRHPRRQTRRPGGNDLHAARRQARGGPHGTPATPCRRTTRRKCDRPRSRLQRGRGVHVIRSAGEADASSGGIQLARNNRLGLRRMEPRGRETAPFLTTHLEHSPIPQKMRRSMASVRSAPALVLRFRLNQYTLIEQRIVL